MNSFNHFIFTSFIVLCVTISNSFSQNEKWQYCGEEPPGTKAKIFAPNFVTTGIPCRDIAITPDGKEIYFTYHNPTFLYSTILYTKYENGIWTKPQVAPFAVDSRFQYTEPCISYDGSKFYFVSNRTDSQTGEKASFDIWYMNKTDNGWSAPFNIGEPVNSKADEFFPSLTKSGTIYFTREGENRSNAIYRSKLVDGKYTEPEKLPEQINIGLDRFNAFINPDEEYLIVSVFRAKDGKGATDYYIAFRNFDDTWQDAINMGDKVNSTFNEYSPYVTRDGKYFFFMSMKPDENLFNAKSKFDYEGLQKIHNSPGNGNNTIYWIDAQFIKELKK